MMPTSRPSGSTIGTPLIENRAMSSWALRSDAPGPSVMGLRIIPLSERFTRSTSRACRSMGMFLWMTPTPPSRATAIAMRASVTVSIAAETSGTCKEMRLVRRVEMSVSFGWTRE